MGDGPSAPAVGRLLDGPHARVALSDAGRHLRQRALHLAGFVLVIYAVLKLIPVLKAALRSIEHASLGWLPALFALEVLSEVGFVLAWSAIVDPQNILGGGAGRRMDERVAWIQLGGGLILPGGAWGGVGVGALILHRFGMPNKVIAERQLNLSFLNTTIDALALIGFGAGLATGIFAGESNLLLTLLPAAVAAGGIGAALLIAPRAAARGGRLDAKHSKVATTLTTLAAAVQDTKRLLSDRSAWAPVLGIIAYLGFDAFMLWCAFHAVHAHTLPGFPILIMAYVIGALGGSIPLPAAAGTVGGIAGMLIVYGVSHNAALAAVLLHQAIGLLVPLIGGAIAYTVLRHRLGPAAVATGGEPAGSQPETSQP